MDLGGGPDDECTLFFFPSFQADFLAHLSLNFFVENSLLFFFFCYYY